ncbi:helix-turn-helix domain-containing protein [Nocardia otitidiscaviarum]|uniref:helix-turn-helix domain-containing protein n=1 Tax=Nocardia otitidiscaviarum TaxID=1823 RepID=UPI002454B97A|nr:helix-turn-helix domain-containing protein [Nocardia otitidiscaviarum]
MSAELNRSALERTELRSGADESAAEVFEQWEALLGDSYVPLASAPLPSGTFHGRIELGHYDDVDLSTVGSTPQEARRTNGLIARSSDEYLIATVQLGGHGRLYQDGRVAEVGPGSLVFLSTTRPYHWVIPEEWEMAVVRVPLARIRELTGLVDDELPTASAVSHDSPAGVVARYFRDLAELQGREPDQARLLMAPGMDLLASAVTLAAGGAESEQSADAFARQRVLDFMRARCTDPELTVDRIADGCAMSRRTLYRVFDDFEEGPAAVLRRMRVEHACEMLARDSMLPIAVVAAASGFLTERHFYRAFRVEKGTTPASFRVVGRGTGTDGR